MSMYGYFRGGPAARARKPGASRAVAATNCRRLSGRMVVPPIPGRSTPIPGGSPDHRSLAALRRLPRPVLAPEPAERVGQDGAAVSVAVETLAVDEPVVVPRELQGLGHLLVGQRPVAVGIVEVVGAILQEDADRLPGRRLA